MYFGIQVVNRFTAEKQEFLQKSKLKSNSNWERFWPYCVVSAGELSKEHHETESAC